MKTITALAAVLLIFCQQKAKYELISLLPDISDYPSLQILQEPVIYPGEELFTMINGGADIYYEYGFRQALSVAYLSDNNNRIEIQLYEMADAPAAFGMLTHSRSSNDSIRTKTDYFVLSYPNYIMFSKGPCFGILSWTSTTGDALLYSMLVNSITDKIAATSGYHSLINQTLAAGVGIEQLKFIRGSIALSSFYFFSHKDLFGIENALAFKKDGVNYIVFSYTNKEKAAKQLELIKAEYSASSRVTGYNEEEELIGFTDRKGQRVTFSAAKGLLFVTIAPHEEITDWNWLIGVFGQ